ncbi:MAG TPA: chemotaxis protein CheD [archaeon]|nr:chemotaxis protein CheD [archaeon]
MFPGYAQDFSDSGDIILHIGHYSIVDYSKERFRTKSRTIIYGLGSCIALIMFDDRNKMGGMSHILLPSSKRAKNIGFPHKYADLSVKCLTYELISKGAHLKNINAIIIGGSRIFDNMVFEIGRDNVKTVKKHLTKFNIKIVKEETGGSKGRTVIYEPFNNNLVLVKFTSEKDYCKL